LHIDDIPWKITKLGLNLGLISWVFAISAFNLSRISLAMAVPSIFVPAMTMLVEEKALFERAEKPNPAADPEFPAER